MTRPSDPDQLRAQFLQRLNEVVPAARLDGVLAALREPSRVTFRRIASRATEEAMCAALGAAAAGIAPVSAFPGWYSVPFAAREALTRSPAAEDGLIYVQNLSSLLPVLALDPQPGEENLDLAAAPGGKTLLMAERMRGEGRIAAVEAVKPRFFRLRANLGRHAASMVDTYLKDGRRVGRQCPGRFDRVLLDAPCSSEARIRLDDPETWAHWSPRKVKEMQRKQKGLLRSALEAVRPGGIVVYSTCSFAPEENEEVVSSQLQRFPGATRIEPVDLDVGDALPGLPESNGRPQHAEIGNALRVLPDELFDGFFVCRIRRLD